MFGYITPGGLVFAASITSLPTSTTDSQSCSTMGAYSLGGMLSTALRKVSNDQPGVQVCLPPTDKPGAAGEAWVGFRS